MVLGRAMKKCLILTRSLMVILAIPEKTIMMGCSHPEIFPMVII
jgi:hypothetical protein